MGNVFKIIIYTKRFRIRISQNRHIYYLHVKLRNVQIFFVQVVTYSICLVFNSILDMETGETKYSLWVSFVEIHNESIFDLLDLFGPHKVGQNKKVGLKFADDQDGNVYIKDVTEVGLFDSIRYVYMRGIYIYIYIFPFEPCWTIRMVYLHLPYLPKLCYVGQSGATPRVTRQTPSNHRIWTHLRSCPQLRWQILKIIPPELSVPTRMDISLERTAVQQLRTQNPDTQFVLHDAKDDE